MLRVSPVKRDRLIEIIVNLSERIDKAKLNGWLGEAQGLRHSLTKANEKLRAAGPNAGGLISRIAHQPRYTCSLRTP